MSDVQRYCMMAETIVKVVRPDGFGEQRIARLDEEWYTANAYDALARQFADCNKWRMELEATSRLMAEQLAEYHADHNERMEHIQRLNKELAEAQQRIANLTRITEMGDPISVIEELEARLTEVVVALEKLVKGIRADGDIEQAFQDYPALFTVLEEAEARLAYMKGARSSDFARIATLEQRLASTQGKLERLHVFVDSGQLMKDYKAIEQRLVEVMAALSAMLGKHECPHCSACHLARQVIQKT